MWLLAKGLIMNALSINLFPLIIDVMDWDLAKVKQSKGIVFSHSWTSDLVYINNAATEATEENRWPVLRNSVYQTKTNCKI